MENITKTFIILKGNVENDCDIKLEDSNLGLDVPSLVMARRITSLFMEDSDIIKCSYEHYDESMESGALGKLYVFCVNHLKAEALSKLIAKQVERLDVEIYDFDDPEYYDEELVRAAFKNNPIVRDIRVQEHLESGILYRYVIFDRTKLCQFSAANTADYKGNYTELPEDVMRMISNDDYKFQYCTEV